MNPPTNRGTAVHSRTICTIPRSLARMAPPLLREFRISDSRGSWGLCVWCLRSLAWYPRSALVIRPSWAQLSMRCHQCERPAIYCIEGKNLCLECADKLQSIADRQQSIVDRQFLQNAAMLNLSLDEMDAVVGLRLSEGRV